MNRAEIIAQALVQPPDYIKRWLTETVQTANPGKFVCGTYDLEYSVRRFAAKGHCSVHTFADYREDLKLYASREKVNWSYEFWWHEIEWHGHKIETCGTPVTEGNDKTDQCLLIGESREVIEAFLLALDAFDNLVEGAVLVFQEGCWRHDEELFEDIANSTFDNLILPPGMIHQICEDIQHWLDSRELYEKHGIPWKRGMILIGPPGNGKTHLIKALVNHFKLNALYVRGFSHPYRSDAQNISTVFERARSCAPSILVLEDLDTLVTPQNRSHFLNELDGFAKNTGILAVASANDATKLDPALANRPSRFDRRYVFHLPAARERAAYLAYFTASLDPNLRLSDEQAAQVAAATEGFSYAYLKELVLSAMMSWIALDGKRFFVQVLEDNVGPLLEQINMGEPATHVPEPSEEDDD